METPSADPYDALAPYYDEVNGEPIDRVRQLLGVLASLLVAMTVTPALCALLLRGRNARSDTVWLVWLGRRPGWSGLGT